MASKHQASSLLIAVACLLASVSFQTLHGEARLTTFFTSDPKRCDLDLDLRIADCKKRGLHSVPQNLSRDIEELDLSFNNITALSNSSFQRYLYIAHLDLSHSDIRVIETFAFHPLKDLKKLVLSSNYHLILPTTGLLRWACKLNILDLGFSNLKSLPNDTLRWSPHMETVSLYSNCFSVVNISSCGTVGSVMLNGNHIEQLTEETFIFACQTNYLDLGGNPIRSVDPNVIASLQVRYLTIGINPLYIDVMRNLFTGISLSPIKELTIMNANLTVIPRDIFDPLRNFPLHFLDVALNQVKTLYPNVFSNLTRIDQLFLNGNEIVTIEPDFFEGMQNLRLLNLRNNKIDTINRDSHTWKLGLFELHLSGNLVTAITPSTFLGLENLTLLDISSNERLAVVELTAFTGLTNIQKIDLSNCRIIYLRMYTPMLKSLSLNNMIEGFYLEPRESFKHSLSLVHLDISESGLKTVYLWDATVNVSLFDGLLYLTTLDLSKNSFDDITGALQPGIFQQLSALKDLKLDSCDISNLPSRVFVGLESLQKLSLRGNKIHHLHYNLFEGIHQVRILNIDTNLLAYLDETVFSNNSKLKALSLADNKLNRFNQSTFKLIESSLSLLDLSMNPIVCNCDLKWFPDWLVSESIKLINTEVTVCSSSSLVTLREKPLLDFDPSELCRLNIALICSFPLVCICLVVIVVLVHHNRWQLKNQLFLLKLAALGYKEIRDARDHNDYEFDVNIIFYDDDDEWIREYLRPALEEQLPQFQRNVFGDEDLVLGMHYLDSVDYVVTHSYKTITVLSRAAVRDRWFMLKFRTAMDHVSDTQTEFVVVVFLEDIPDEELPFLARLYLSDGRPYLHWTEDVRGREYFWKKLAKNLTLNLRTNDLIPNE